MQPWASHFRFPSLSFSICLVGIPSLHSCGCCGHGRKSGKLAGCAQVWTPRDPRAFQPPDWHSVLRARGGPGWQGGPHTLPSQGRWAAWHPHGALHAVSGQSPGARGCLQPGLTQPPGERLQREGGEGCPHFKAKRKGSQQGILAPHTSLALLPAKSSLLVVHAGDSLPAAETPRAPGY